MPNRSPSRRISALWARTSSNVTARRGASTFTCPPPHFARHTAPVPVEASFRRCARSARCHPALSRARLALELLYGQLAEGIADRRLALVGGAQVDQRGAGAAMAMGCHQLAQVRTGRSGQGVSDMARVMEMDCGQLRLAKGGQPDAAAEVPSPQRRFRELVKIRPSSSAWAKHDTCQLTTRATSSGNPTVRRPRVAAIAEGDHSGLPTHGRSRIRSKGCHGHRGTFCRRPLGPFRGAVGAERVRVHGVPELHSRRAWPTRAHAQLV
jgi:hypothetical protein